MKNLTARWMLDREGEGEEGEVGRNSRWRILPIFFDFFLSFFFSEVHACCALREQSKEDFFFSSFPLPFCPWIFFNEFLMRKRNEKFRAMKSGYSRTDF